MDCRHTVHTRQTEKERVNRWDWKVDNSIGITKWIELSDHSQRYGSMLWCGTCACHGCVTQCMLFRRIKSWPAITSQTPTRPYHLFLDHVVRTLTRKRGEINNVLSELARIGQQWTRKSDRVSMYELKKANTIKGALLSLFRPRKCAVVQIITLSIGPDNRILHQAHAIQCKISNLAIHVWTVSSYSKM